MKNENYETETLKFAKNVQKIVGDAFIDEVTRLLSSGTVDVNKNNKNLVVAVALNNVIQAIGNMISISWPVSEGSESSESSESQS